MRQKVKSYHTLHTICDKFSTEMHILCPTIWLTFVALQCFAYKANQGMFSKWQCEGCGQNVTRTYRRVYRALRTGNREMYIPLDHSWINLILRPTTNLVVHYIDRSKIASSTLIQYESETTSNMVANQKNNIIREGEETFHIVYSPPPKRIVIKKAYHTLSYPEANDIDLFLRNNPCYIPLQEPNAYYNLTHEDLNSDENRFQYSKHDFVYFNSFIAVRLPTYSYHATCKLYTTITNIQFPSSSSSSSLNQQCPTPININRLEAYWLGNIGWVNNLYPMISKFTSSLHNDRIFITPRAQEWGKENIPSKRLYLNIRGSKVKVNGTWGNWASKEECPISTFAFNPWACHFMSLSSCNTGEK